MTHPLVEPAFAIDNSLRPAEASTNDAAIGTANLLFTLLKEHRDSGVPDAICLSAIGHASKAVAAAVEAREHVIRAHGALNVDLKKFGMGEMFSKPDDPPPGDSFAGRWLVGEARAPVEA